jgi:hypothetical protein
MNPNHPSGKASTAQPHSQGNFTSFQPVVLAKPPKKVTTCPATTPNATNAMSAFVFTSKLKGYTESIRVKNLQAHCQ